MSPRLENTATLPTDLSGQWTLDRHDSDDVRARLAPLFEKKERKWRTMEKHMADNATFVEPSHADNPGDSSSEGGADTSTLHWLRDQRQREVHSLIAFVSPATQLEIRQSAHEIRFSSNKGEGTRALVPGEPSSLFVAIGGFAVTSGWQGNSFVVNSNGSGDNVTHIVERYTLLDQGAQLEERVEVRLPALGKQVFRFIYKRNR